VNVLIQNCHTLNYLTTEYHWKREVNAACRFTSSLCALNYIRVNDLKNVQIVLYFGDPRFDLKTAASEG
jgi:hypothetical protein